MMTNDDTAIKRISASDSRVSYSKPIAIRDTEQTYFEVLPLYIPHDTSPDGLSLKLRYWKKVDGGMRIGFPAEFTLNHKEVLNMRDVINRGLALAEQGEDGEYVALNIGSQEVFTPGQETTALGRSLAAALANPQIIEALKDDSEGQVLLGAVHVSARLAELTQAIDGLEAALESEINREGWYQDWFEKNSWAFGNAYTMRDDVRAISTGDSVDILMAQTANGLRDIFELKRPDKPVLHYDSDHRSYYWTAEASKAIGQCHRYIDVLHDEARNGLRDHPEVVAHYPRAFVVQGRSYDWSDDKLRALHGLNCRLHGVQIMTFDQLLAQCNQLLSIMTTAASPKNDKAQAAESDLVGVPTSQGDPWSTQPSPWSDDDPPF